MSVHFAHFSEDIQLKSQVPATAVIAVLVGLGLGGLFTLLWSPAPGLQSLAVWPAGIGMGLIAVAVISARLRQEPQWGMAILGQLLGLIAIALLLIASLS